MTPTTTLRSAVAAAAVLLLATMATAQPSNVFLELSPAALAETWLLRNCGVDDEPRLELAVDRRAEELRPRFFEAWREGPPTELVEATRRAAADRFKRSRQLLADPESLGLAPEDAERASGRSEEKFVARAVANLTISYRERALEGLRRIGGEQGRKLLEEIAADPRSPFAAGARRLLEDGPRGDGA